MAPVATMVLRTSLARSCARGTMVPFSRPFHSLVPRPFSHCQTRQKPTAATDNQPLAMALRWRAATPRRASSTKPLPKSAVDAKGAAPHELEKAPLDWNTFFRLRKTRRRWQLGFSVLLGGTGAMVGGLFLSTGVADSFVKWVPMDPFVTLGMMTTCFGLLGWLAGPSVGGLVFGMLQSKYRAQMVVKESQFFARIKKNRVDPSRSSASNPVPDFYGEKISSIAGYRQWLKDQRAFNKKRETFV